MSEFEGLSVDIRPFLSEFGILMMKAEQTHVEFYTVMTT